MDIATAVDRPEGQERGVARNHDLRRIVRAFIRSEMHGGLFADKNAADAAIPVLNHPTARDIAANREARRRLSAGGG
jgi:hypothetical protein